MSQSAATARPPTRARRCWATHPAVSPQIGTSTASCTDGSGTQKQGKAAAAMASTSSPSPGGRTLRLAISARNSA
jgi:hypothetical protein